jgi:SM-20-related protein
MELYQTIADELALKGYSVQPQFFDNDFCTGLRNEQNFLLEQGAFRQAGIGRGAEFKIAPEIRSDFVLWLHSGNLTALQQVFWDRMDAFRLSLNRELYLGLNSFECHYAVYPPGSFYKRHVDQHKLTRHRIISCILYLNPNWKEEDAGQLRIYEKDEQGNEYYTDVAPQLGTLVCFRSDKVEHEVLPTHSHRFSITGWMRNDAYLL